MKNKILVVINSTLFVTVLISIFLPIDTICIYGINLLLGILSLIFFLVTFFIKKEKQFLILFFLQLILIFTWYIFIICQDSPDRIGWKVYLYLLIAPIFLSDFIIANQVFNKRKFLLWCFIILQSCIFIKILLFTKFYKFEGNKEYFEDIRNYSNPRQYKVLNPHKLLNKNPEKLSEKDYKLIYELINNSSWIKDNFSEFDEKFFNEIDISYIKDNTKYSFSVINLYSLKKADFYKISIPIKNQQTKINIYFPKGTFYLSKDNLEIYKNYYNVLPNEIKYCIYEGLGLPYNQREYETYIDNYYNWSK